MEANHTIPTAPFPLAHSRKSRSKTKSKETIRKIAFYLTVALVFIRTSQIHELITYRFNFNSYLLFVVGSPSDFRAVHFQECRQTLSLPAGIFLDGILNMDRRDCSFQHLERQGLSRSLRIIGAPMSFSSFY